MLGYISEVSYTGGRPADFIELSVPAGTDISGYSVQVYDGGGTLQNSYGLGAVQQTIAGSSVYLIDDANTPGFSTLAVSNSIALIDDTGTVVQFISFNGATVTAVDGGAAGSTSTDIGHAVSGGSLQSDNGGSSYYVQNAPNRGTTPCYAPGTMIETPGGPRAVETLVPGDLVMTHDNGPQAIRWTRSGDHPLQDAKTDAKPVQIKAGALGRNLPAQDLIVSPQHGILVGGAGQLTGVFASEAFAPAKALTAVPGIRHMKGKKQITWVHFACDRHEVVTANGCLSESLLLGLMVINGLTTTERRTLTFLFKPVATPDAALNGPPARECLKVGAVRRQIASHRKEKGRLVAKEIRKWDCDLAMEEYEARRVREAASSVYPDDTAAHVA